MVDEHYANAGDIEPINIIFPVLNEEGRLEHGIYKTVEVLDEICPGSYVLTIADNGSTDKTKEIALALVGRFDNVDYFEASDKGVGLAFREGIMRNTSPIVGYMDIDLATSPAYMSDVIGLFSKGVEMVNGSRWAAEGSQKGRPLMRRVTSVGLTSVLRFYLGMNATDAICGFKFFRKEIAEALVEYVPKDIDGWSYIIELLLNAERSGVVIAELPVKWMDDGNSGVKVVPQIRRYLKDFHKIRQRI